MICAECAKTYNRIFWDGIGEPTTYEMVEYGEGKDDELFHFCSKKCMNRYELTHPEGG